MNIPAKAGEEPLRVHLEQVERSTGHHDERLDAVKIPDGFEYLFEIYFRIRRGEAITYRDIDAYQSVTGYEFDSFELKALFAMDSAMEEYLAERFENSTKGA